MVCIIQSTLKLSTAFLLPAQEPISNQCTLYFPKSAAYVSTIHVTSKIFFHVVYKSVCTGNNLFCHMHSASATSCCMFILLTIENNPDMVPLQPHNPVISLNLQQLSPIRPVALLSQEVSSNLMMSVFVLLYRQLYKHKYKSL